MNLSDSLSATTKSKLDVLNALVVENDKATLELNKLKILKCALKNVNKNGVLGNPKLTEKLHQLVGAEEVLALCHDMPLLGLEVENFTVSLSDTERNEIKPLLENEIKSLHQKLVQYSIKEESGADESDLPTNRIEQRMGYKLHLWNEGLLSMATLIKDLQDVRQEVKLLRQKDISCLSATCEELELEAKTLALQIQMQIYSENPYVIPATRKLSLSVDEEYRIAVQELQDLKHRKEAYEKLKGTEYDEVLQEYIKMKKEIDIKCWALSKLENVGL